MPKKSLILAALVALPLAACQKDLNTSSATSPVKLAASGSAGNLVGVPPAPPTTMQEINASDGRKPLAETPGTTSVADQEKELSKSEEANSMPLPGQPNDHSNVASGASQKVGQADPQQSAERSGESNAPQREGRQATRKP